jgi:hypothetical protein
LQDGQQIPPSEGIAARQMLPGLLQQLRQELLAEGIDPDKAAQVIDSLQCCLADLYLADLCKIVSQVILVPKADIEQLSALCERQHL